MGKIVANNYTQVPNAILESITEFTPAEFKLFMVLCRLTLGWHDTECVATYAEIAKLTGLTKQGVINAAATLGEKKYIAVTKQGYRTTWRIVIDEANTEYTAEGKALVVSIRQRKTNMVNSLYRVSTNMVNSVDKHGKLSLPSQAQPLKKERKDFKESADLETINIETPTRVTNGVYR